MINIDAKDVELRLEIKALKSSNKELRELLQVTLQWVTDDKTYMNIQEALKKDGG